MVHIPRGAFFGDVPAPSGARSRDVVVFGDFMATVAVAGFVVSGRGDETSGGDASTLAGGVETVFGLVVTVVVVARGAGIADPADGTGAARVAPAGVTLGLEVGAGAVDGDVTAVAVEQWPP